MSKNVFEVLGLKTDHRPTSKIAQLAKHTAEVNVVANQAGPFYVDEKYDGNHTLVVIKKGKILGLFSRVGKQFTNTAPVEKLINAKKATDGVYYAELYCEREVMPMQRFQALHGPNRSAALTEAQQAVMDNEAKLAIFDYITLEEFIAGESSTPLEKRRKTYEKAIKKFSKSGRVHPARYVKADTFEEAVEACDDFIKAGKEGGVAKGTQHGYICGHKNFHFMKKVKKITLDLVCIGYVKGTRGKRKDTLEKLQFRYGKNGEHTIDADLGKGYTDEERLAMLKECEKGGKKSPVGLIYEVYALEKIGQTNLRQAKVGKLREDKDEADKQDLPETTTKKEKKVKKEKKAKKGKAAKPKKYEDMSFEELFSVAKALKIDVPKKVVKKEKSEELISLIKEHNVDETPEPKSEKKGKKDKPKKEDKKEPKSDKKKKKKGK